MTAWSDLRILHIGSGSYWPQDRGHTTYAIWRELARGFRSYRVIARSAGAAADWSDGNLRITLIRSLVGREAEFLLTQFLAVPRAVRERPNVIVCQSPVAGGLAAILIAWLTDARILMELHGAEFFAVTRTGSSLWLLQRLSRFMLLHADLIRVLSPRMGQMLVQRYGSNLAARTRVLPPRVDVAQFAPQKRIEKLGGPLRLAMVGTLNRNKGQLRLIRVLEATLLPIELHLAGDGPDLADCRDRAAMLPEAGSKLWVKCHGPLSHAGVADMLRSCDLFVMYSRTEATPRAMMEAMAVGLPVVTTNAGFCADIIEDGVEGFVLGPNPDCEIVQVLDRFRADPSLARRMGAAARTRAERDYDSVRLLQEYRQLIAETARR